jgi:hypothetical protein
MGGRSKRRPYGDEAKAKNPKICICGSIVSEEALQPTGGQAPAYGVGPTFASDPKAKPGGW